MGFCRGNSCRLVIRKYDAHYMSITHIYYVLNNDFSSAFSGSLRFSSCTASKVVYSQHSSLLLHLNLLAFQFITIYFFKGAHYQILKSV